MVNLRVPVSGCSNLQEAEEHGYDGHDGASDFVCLRPVLLLACFSSIISLIIERRTLHFWGVTKINALLEIKTAHTKQKHQSFFSLGQLHGINYTLVLPCSLCNS